MSFFDRNLFIDLEKERAGKSHETSGTAKKKGQRSDGDFQERTAHISADFKG